MKLACSLLALIVLVLSMQAACAADPVANHCAHHGVTGGQKDLPYHNHGGDCGKGCLNCCNPFQVCSCCISGAIVAPELSLSIKHYFPTQIFRWKTSEVNLTDRPGSSFWHPPQVS